MDSEQHEIAQGALTSLMAEDLWERAAALKRAGEPFVLATVVWSQRPTSARPGAKGIVTQDGALFGWVGGSCAQPTVVREALHALEDGRPRVLQLTPDGRPDPTRAGIVTAPMTCHSGGALEIFLEPFLPPLRMVVFGDSPVADALLRLGYAMGYRVIAVRPEPASPPPEGVERADEPLTESIGAGRGSIAVVATMGVYDEDAVEQALRAGVEFVALVASRRRFESMVAMLRASGVADDLMTRVKAPAGLDIGASAPEEIAVSILAEIIARRAERSQVTDEQPATTAPAKVAIDPVCGMEVEVATARHILDYQGARYYFCCPACRRQFEADPARFLFPE